MGEFPPALEGTHYYCNQQENEERPSFNLANDSIDHAQEVIDRRRPSEPKYCAMNSVIISPPPSRQSSVRTLSPRMRAETLTVPNTWIGSESTPNPHRVRKISHPTYTFLGEERPYDFPGKSRSGLLYAEDDYRLAAGQFIDSSCPCVAKYPEPTPETDRSSSMEENKPSQVRNDTTQAYHRLLLFVAAVLLFILLVTGITVATKRIGKSTKIDIVEVIEILKSKQTESPKVADTTTKRPFFKDIPDRNEVETVTEEVEMICCKVVRVQSTAKVAQVYPSILGEYRKTKMPSDRPIYAKLGSPMRYLSQPQSDKHVLGYSWGVSQTPQAKWGYIRSSKAGPCPTMAGKWKVFDKETKRWLVDKTLKIVCKEP